MNTRAAEALIEALASRGVDAEIVDDALMIHTGQGSFLVGQHPEHGVTVEKVA